MHQTPQDDLRRLYRFGDDDAPLDNRYRSPARPSLPPTFPIIINL